jgi:hypothetical protein
MENNMTPEHDFTEEPFEKMDVFSASRRIFDFEVYSIPQEKIEGIVWFQKMNVARDKDL